MIERAANYRGPKYLGPGQRRYSIKAGKLGIQSTQCRRSFDIFPRYKIGDIVLVLYIFLTIK